MSKLQKLTPTGIVEKQNVLVELKSNSMTLQELRFFSIYLSKINARDLSTRAVRFKLSEFQRIMEFGRINIGQLKDTTDRLLQKIVHVPTENGGYTAFQLFKECTVDQDVETGEWYVEIDAHDKALPLMFDFKERYFTYELWNALRLRSSNQLKMYELLKEYEHIGKREVQVTDLRRWLGIGDNEYPRWDNLRDKVINACQKALAEYTDICFTYERGRYGRGGKWISIIFYIKKNPNHIDQLTLQDFIDEQDDMTVEQIDGQVSIFDNDIVADTDTLSPIQRQLYNTLKDISSRYYGKYNPDNFTEYALNTYIKQAKDCSALEDDNIIIAYIAECYERMCKERNIKNPNAYLTSIIQRRYDTIPLEYYGVDQEHVHKLKSFPEDKRLDISAIIIGKYRSYKESCTGDELKRKINWVAEMYVSDDAIDLDQIAAQKREESGI